MVYFSENECAFSFTNSKNFELLDISNTSQRFETNLEKRGDNVR